MPVRKVELQQVFCCNEDCNVPGPMAWTRAGAMFDASIVGWEIMMGLTICPRCAERGHYPSDIEDAVVTLPATADVPAVVEVSHDA